MSNLGRQHETTFFATCEIPATCGPSNVYNDHEPAHFHAEHQGLQAKFDFSGEVVAGAIESRTALRLTREWALLHRSDLEENWRLMKTGQPLRHIAPLE